MPRSYCHTYSGYPRVGFCFSTERHPGASSTRHRRFPGEKGTLLHSSNNVPDEFTGSFTQSIIYRICSVLQEYVYPSRIANVDEIKVGTLSPVDRESPSGDAVSALMSV